MRNANLQAQPRERKIEFPLGRIDYGKLEEVLSYWAGCCGIGGPLEENLKGAVRAVAHAIEEAKSSDKQRASFLFEPYDFCLAVTVEFPKHIFLQNGDELTPATLAQAVQGADRVLWREDSGRVSLRLAQFTRAEGRIGELYFLNLRPGIAKGVVVSSAPDGSGVLSREKAEQILRLPPMGMAAVQAMDGNTSLRDIYRELVSRFGLFQPRQLGSLVEQLYKAGMIVLGQRLFREEAKRTWWRRLNRLLTLDLPIRNSSERMAWLGRTLGWLYGRSMLLFWVCFVVVSLIIFNFDLDEYHHVFENPMKVLDWLSFWGLLAFYLCLGLIVVIHELSHALTCQRNGGTVGCFGFMVYYGCIMAYCDTSASWGFADKWRRMAVSFAGPMSNLVIACVLAWMELALVRIGAIGAGHFCGALAMISMLLAVFNLLPVLKLDGYYILADFTGLPRLKSDSQTYLMNVLRRRPTHWEKPLSKVQQMTLVGYGVISPLFGLGLLGLLAWKLSYNPFYQVHRYWFWFGIVLLVATIAQKLFQAGHNCYVKRRLHEILIKC